MDGYGSEWTDLLHHLAELLLLARDATALTRSSPAARPISGPPCPGHVLYVYELYSEGKWTTGK